MKGIKILLTAAMVAVSASAFAQDFSDPKYAKWGETAEQRKENILANSYLKEEVNNRNYNLAAKYLQQLISQCPAASENIYANGAKLYKQKINRAQSLEEKKMYVDSLLWVYDVRLENFASHSKRGKDYILERKAREFMTYRESDREGLRAVFGAAIAAQIEKLGKADPEIVAIHFKNLCDDYAVDLVTAIDIVNAYEELAKNFEGIAPEQEEYKNQFETSFGVSGAANCENLEAIFSKKLADTPNDETVLNQAFALLSRANCNNAFFFTVGENLYKVKPTSATAMALAQAYQDNKNYTKANQYLREALAAETDATEREKIYVRIGILEMTSNNHREAVDALREARKINPENGYAVYFLAQCYIAGASGCQGLAKEAVYWVAYDMMQQAAPLLADEAELAANAKEMAARYRQAFPTMEECFFNEVKEGETYVVNCGFVSGISTVVRYRPQ